ncbi:MAG: alkaline phosphatase family protein [Ilumatobacteraceae bacterium]
MSFCGEVRYAIVRTRDEWRSRMVYACTTYADEGSQKCSQWKDEGENKCSQWADHGSNQCCDWAPCSWFCDAFYWVAKWVCIAYYWVANLVCQAWYWVAKWVCRVFAWIVYWVLTIIAWLVWIVVWIPCHVFGGPLGPGGPIKHVFVLVLENRSFDHMLGVSTSRPDPEVDWTLGVGVDAVTGDPTTVNGPSANETNTVDGQVFTLRAGAPFLMPVDPPHEFCDVQLQLASTAINGNPQDDSCDYSGVYPQPLTMAGFVANYRNQAVVEPDATLKAQALADLGAVMACFTPDQVPVISTLARTFAMCDQWYSALPGPTWPNRFFLHAATSGGLDRSPSSAETALSYIDGYQFENGTIYDALDSEELSWRVYHGDAFPQVGGLAGMDLGTMATNFHGFDDFAEDLQDKDFDAAYVFIEPNYGHVLTHHGNFQCGNSQHPIDDVTRGEKLIKQVYEAIRQSPHWDSSVLIVTYDEHGGFYDHVAPPRAVPPGDIIDPDNNAHGFKFDQQGVRVPAIVASPLIPTVTPAGIDRQNCNLIDHTQYDHGSLLRTVEQIFGLSALTRRDASANEFSHLMSLATARADAPLTLPEPADSGFRCDDDPTGTPIGPGSPGEAHDAIDATERPVTSTVRGFLHVAAIMDARMNPHDKAEIVERVANIDNLAEANNYMNSVAAHLAVDKQARLAAGANPRAARTERRRRRSATRKRGG